MHDDPLTHTESATSPRLALWLSLPFREALDGRVPEITLHLPTDHPILFYALCSRTRSRAYCQDTGSVLSYLICAQNPFKVNDINDQQRLSTIEH